MAVPTSPGFSSFDVTARTEGRSVDSILWDAMFTKSRMLEVIGKGPKINQQRYEWIGLAADPTIVTASGTTDLATGAASTVFAVAAADYASLCNGMILVNATRATPIGTYQRNELIRINTYSTTTGIAAVTRDAGNFNSGTGSTLHQNTNTFRILYNPVQEGSDPQYDPNMYVADTILENYTAIQSMKMQLTGSQKARAMEVVSSELERQWQRSLINLKNQVCQMVLYGYNSATAVGSSTVIRQSKGILDFIVDNIVAANPCVDYTTTVLTAKSINDLLIKLANNGADPESSNLKIVTSYQSKDVMGNWDADLVRTTIDNEQVGREVSVFKSTLGFQCEIIADPRVQKSDLFIIDPAKIKVIPFREFETEQWGKDTSAPNGFDLWAQRTIGEHTLQVVDPGVAHAAMTYLSFI
jgi:hypothetical protein